MILLIVWCVLQYVSSWSEIPHQLDLGEEYKINYQVGLTKEFTIPTWKPVDMFITFSNFTNQEYEISFKGESVKISRRSIERKRQTKTPKSFSCTNERDGTYFRVDTCNIYTEVSEDWDVEYTVTCASGNCQTFTEFTFKVEINQDEVDRQYRHDVMVVGIVMASVSIGIPCFFGLFTFCIGFIILLPFMIVLLGSILGCIICCYNCKYYG